MTSFNESVVIVTSAAAPLERVSISLAKAKGLVLAADVHAAIDSPRNDVSAMDGYAVSDRDLGTVPCRLRVRGEAFAGQPNVADLAAASCTRIFTGGTVPANADRVIVQEVVGRDGEWADFTQPPGPARHIRSRSSDFAAGDLLLPAGTLLGPRTLIAAAAADLAQVIVWRRPRFTILSTGDELAVIGTARFNPGSIPESISVGVGALAEEWGGEWASHRLLRDEPEVLEAAAREALDTSDVVIVTGGASVGEKDFAKSMFAPFSPELLFSKVAIKPGKPVWLAIAQGRLVLGLPGNPTSAMVTARLFLAPLIARLAGRDPATALQWKWAEVARSLPACGDRETFLRARWSSDQVEAIGNQDSGAQKALAECDVLIRRRPEAAPVPVGDLVEVLDF